MDCKQTGLLIAKLRKEKGFKQKQIAEALHISEKTVSKWERGLGFPDVSLLNEIAFILEVKVEVLLNGSLNIGKTKTGNLNNLKFYICNKCGNIMTTIGDIKLYCCDRAVKSTLPVKMADENKLTVEKIENELFVSSNRTMTKEDYVTFVAYVFNDKYTFIKQYPEWNLQVRFFYFGHGKLIWGTNMGELFYQIV